MHFKLFILAASISCVYGTGNEFVTVTKTHAAVARDAVCSAEASGIPPVCLDDYEGKFDPHATYSDPSPPSRTSISGPSITKPPAPPPSCALQKADPDQGVNKPFCVCDRTATLPVLSLDLAKNPGPDASCAYSSIAKSTINVVNSLGPAITNTKICSICTPLVVNEDSCTSIPNCVPEVTGPMATMEMGSSYANVGTLTGTALYTSISSALEHLCPPVTQTQSETTCATGTVSIGKVPYNDDGTLGEGELEISVQSSRYNETSLRNAMIQTSALTAKQSAAGKNCHEFKYMKNELGKRGTMDWILDPLGLGMDRRADHPHPVQKTMTICNAVGFTGVQYFTDNWRSAPPGAQDFLDVTWHFEKPQGGGFGCEFAAVLADLLVAVAPEFAVGEIELGEAIRIVCKEIK